MELLFPHMISESTWPIKWQASRAVLAQWVATVTDGIWMSGWGRARFLLVPRSFSLSHMHTHLQQLISINSWRSPFCRVADQCVCSLWERHNECGKMWKRIRNRWAPIMNRDVSESSLTVLSIAIICKIKVVFNPWWCRIWEHVEEMCFFVL